MPYVDCALHVDLNHRDVFAIYSLHGELFGHVCLESGSNNESAVDVFKPRLDGIRAVVVLAIALVEVHDVWLHRRSADLALWNHTVVLLVAFCVDKLLFLCFVERFIKLLQGGSAENFATAVLLLV